MTRRAKPSAAILRQAAEWHAILRDGEATEAERADWRQWLAASELHLAAWRSVEAIGQQFEPLRQAPAPEQILATLQRADQRLRRRLLTGLAVISAGGLAGGLGWRHAPLRHTILAFGADYQTAVGEQRDLLLTDGTRLWLNTASAVDADYGPALRRLTLLAGEIFIETGADAARPLVVDTRHGRLKALGTRFNILLTPDATRLAVYAGAVSIRSAGLQTSRELRAGQQARFNAAGISAVAPADNAREAWTRGLLLAEDTALHELIAELSRYRPGHITLADEIATLKVYGAFPLRDTDRALNMLGRTLPIEIEYTMPGRVHIKLRGTR